MMKWVKSLGSIFVVSFTVLLCANAFSASEILTFDNDSLRERYETLIFQLRCPKCQNQNVADSNAPISEDIRQKTYELLHQGYEDQEIIDFMVDRYTEFVIYKPQLSMLTIWLWLVPLFIFIVGLITIFRLVQKNNANAQDVITDAERAKLDKLLGDK